MRLPLSTLVFPCLAISLAGCPMFTPSDEPTFDAPTTEVVAPSPAAAPTPTPPPRPAVPQAVDNEAAPEPEVSARHILVQFQGSQRAPATITRTRDEARARAEQALARVRRDPSAFTTIVSEFTDEPGGAERGGDLRSFSRRRMVPPFAEAAFALDVNEVSGIVETPFGFHIIQRYR